MIMKTPILAADDIALLQMKGYQELLSAPPLSGSIPAFRII
jgi:hypothetical protein